MKPDIRKRLLDMVVARLGKDAVAKRLRVSAATIDNWMRAETPIPEHRLVDLIDALEATLKK